MALQETLVATYMSAYIEVDHGEHSHPFSDPAQVYSLTEGSFAFGKDYEVFDEQHGRERVRLVFWFS